MTDIVMGMLEAYFTEYKCFVFIEHESFCVLDEVFMPINLVCTSEERNFFYAQSIIRWLLFIKNHCQNIDKAFFL